MKKSLIIARLIIAVSLSLWATGMAIRGIVQDAPTFIIIIFFLMAIGVATLLAKPAAYELKK